MIVSPLFDAALAGVLGLLVGSFLNVVIYRLPQMLERQWEAECAALGGQPSPEAAEFNLMRPRSRCRQCGHVIRWYENVPVVSYLALRGKEIVQVDEKIP
jgi:leader peptidase (prepilin peptidase)/N-methyltransferase